MKPTYVFLDPARLIYIVDQIAFWKNRTVINPRGCPNIKFTHRKLYYVSTANSFSFLCTIIWINQMDSPKLVDTIKEKKYFLSRGFFAVIYLFDVLQSLIWQLICCCLMIFQILFLNNQLHWHFLLFWSSHCTEVGFSCFLSTLMYSSPSTYAIIAFPKNIA